jgi:hypothetical protein
MPALDRLHQAEARFLDLLAEAGFPLMLGDEGFSAAG